MTTDELKKEAEEKWWNDTTTSGASLPNKIFIAGYLASAEPREKRIEELEEKISVLLSCKNCPENKGGYICEKEYENKCLTQKIQYIKELQQENAELKTIIESEHEIEARKNNKLISRLIKAKKLLKILLENYVSEPEVFSDGSCEDNELRNLINEVEQFLKDSEVKE